MPSPSSAAAPARIAAIRAGMRGSLTRTFAALGILAVLLPLLVVFVLVASAAQQQVTEQVAAQLESVAALQRWQIDEWLHNRELTLRLLSGQPGAQESARTLFVAPPGGADYVAASARLRELLAAVQASDDAYFAFMVVDARDAHVVLSTDRRYEGLTLSNHMVYVTLNCDFVMDCHDNAVDGNFIGGRFPTGNGLPGSTFRSWFRVRDRR